MEWKAIRTGGALILLTALFGASVGTGIAPLRGKALTEPYAAETALVNPPTVACDVRSRQTLEAVVGSVGKERPANAILHLDGGNVVDGSGETLGNFAEICGEIAESVIPVAAVSDRAGTDAVVSYVQESGASDLAVLSADPDLVKDVRERCPDVRGIVRLSGKTAYECVKTAQLCRAGTVLLPADEASYETVYFLQSRFKAVWAEAGDETQVHAAVVSGAYGVVAEDFGLVYRAYGEYKTPVHARMPFNVAHRGLPSTHHENSVSGTMAAIEAGATHVELDGKLTTDGQIVMMHDDRIERTAEGAGNIESMTLAEVKEHKLDLFEPHEEIPTLEEILPLFEGTDAVLVFEIKTDKTELVSKLKEILDRTNFYEHIVVIAFGYPALDRMQQELPQVPTADLNSYSESNLGEKLSTLGNYNCAVSTSGSSSVRFNEMLRDRGIIGWYWTQETERAVDEAFERGLTGLTNNVGAYFGGKKDIYKVVLGDVISTERALQAGDETELVTVRYNGDMTQVRGEIARIADRGSYYDVISSYKSGDMLYYTPLYRVEKTGALAPKEEKKGCNGTVGAGGAFLLLSAVLAAAVLLAVRKKG